MPVVDNYISGKTGSVQVPNLSSVLVPYSFSKWTAMLTAKLNDITNFTTQGYQKMLSSIVSASLTVSGPYNAGNMNPPFTQAADPANGPPTGGASGAYTGFAVGVQYTFFLGWTASLALAIPAIIETIDIADDVQTDATISITAKSTGPFSAFIQ
jgi:hypothetical protein